MPARIWWSIWAGRPPHWGIALPAVVTSLGMAIPLFYVVVRAAEGGPPLWATLWNTRLPALLLNTLRLTLAVSAVAVFLGVPLAWLAVRTDLPGARRWSWISVLPLAFPPYVGAFVYVTVFGPVGLVETALTRWTGLGREALPLPSVYGFWSVTLVLALFTYPYVFVLASAALRSANRTLEEAAQAAGLSPAAVFFRVTLPLLRPAIGAGALLVALYVLSDFGTVAMLRFETFTSAIYLQLIGRLNRSAAAALSAVLVALTGFVLYFESNSRRRARYYQTVGTWRAAQAVRLGALKWPALLFVGLVNGLSVFIPLATLAYWAALGVRAGAVDGRFWTFCWNTLATTAAGATIIAVLALPVAYLSARHPGPASLWINRLSQAGYALPGVVVALGLIFFFNRYLPAVYRTSAMVVVAYVARFLPQSIQAQEAALQQVSPNLEEAARSCGHRPLQVLRRVTLPLVAPGVAAGWALAFLSALKELPATLLLRPPGLDTLAVRVWLEAREAFFDRAGPPALLLVALGLVPMVLLLRSGRAGAAPPLD